MLLERERELTALRGVLASGGCAFVRGPAGIGKTALLDSVESAFRARGTELDRDFVAYGLLGRVADPSFHALYWALVDRGAAVLVVDDAHWLDELSLRWLLFLVNRGMTLVIAARDEPSELLSRIALHDATTVIEPAPLSLAAVAELGGDAALHKASGGNPFYVHALLTDDTRSVADSIALRLAAMPPECLRLARALAVLDGAASGTVAARVAGLDVRGFVAAAEALARADILRGESFAHPIVRRAIYEGIPAPERRELHLAAARLLRSPEHVIAAGPGGGDWAVQVLREAARAAWARGAPETAATYLLHALEEDTQRDEVLRELARATVAYAGPDGLAYFREPSLELGRALFLQGYFADACAALEGHEEEHATVAVLDLAVVRRLGGLDAIAARVPGSAIAAWIAAARHPGYALPDVTPDLSPSARGAALVALMAAGRYEQADAIWSETAEAARAKGALDELRFAVVARAIVRVRMGRVAEAEADLRELIAWVGELELPLAQYRKMLPLVIAPLIDALIERGQLDEAARWPALAGLESGWPEEFGFTFLIDSLARLRLAQGRHAEAAQLAEECGRRQRAWGIENPGFVAWQTTLGTPEACDAQLAAARAFGATREEGMALLARGEFRAAADVLAGSPARLEYARALLGLGGREALREALDIAERLGATVVADEARRQLVASGARPRRTATTGVAALTATQLRVAQLAASGLGNRQIAERLFVTEKTVEGHLAGVYRKLGIGSRAQLADITGE